MRKLCQLLVVLSALALSLSACGGPSHVVYRNGDYSVTSDRINSNGWGYAVVSLDKTYSCIKWQGSGAAGLGCLLGRPFGYSVPALYSSVKGDSSGWSVTRILGDAAVLCIKWSGQGDEAGDMSCFKEEDSYDGSKAHISSHKTGGGWSVAEISVPGQHQRLCYKFEEDNGKSGGGALISCLLEQSPLESAVHLHVGSSNLGHGWSLERISASAEPTVLCLKWHSDNADAGYCFPEERQYQKQAVDIATFNIGGHWSTHVIAIPGYKPFRCIKWSTSDAGGMSCLQGAN